MWVLVSLTGKVSDDCIRDLAGTKAIGWNSLSKKKKDWADIAYL